MFFLQQVAAVFSKRCTASP